MVGRGRATLLVLVSEKPGGFGMLALLGALGRGGVLMSITHCGGGGGTEGGSCAIFGG